MHYIKKQRTDRKSQFKIFGMLKYIMSKYGSLKNNGFMCVKWVRYIMCAFCDIYMYEFRTISADLLSEIHITWIDTRDIIEYMIINQLFRN